MKVIILAAGLGTRLRPITNKKPKCMVKVNGISILEWQISAYLSAGVKEDDIIIIIGYKSEIVTENINKKYNKIKLVVNKDFDTTNNMYSLRLGLEFTQDEDFIVLSNGDCVYENSIIKDLINNRCNDLIPCEVGEYYKENMKITIDKHKRIDNISKQINEEEFYGTSIDLYKLSVNAIVKLRKIINNFLESDKNAWTEVALKNLFQEHEIKSMDINSRKWMEIDNIDDLLIAERKFNGFNIKLKKVIVLDLDGTVYLGDKPIDSSINFINKYGNSYNFYYMTNNTSKSKNDYLRKLSRMGINDIDEKNIINPTNALADYLNDKELTNAYCVGTESFKQELRAHGIKCLDNEEYDLANVVVLGYDTEINYEKLKKASWLLHNEDISYVASHIDNVCPTEKGGVPDIGSYIALFKTTTKRIPEKTFGKPNKDLLSQILSEYEDKDIVIIGDRLYTDKVLADNCNIDFICVLSGESTRYDVELLENCPKLTINELENL